MIERMETEDVVVIPRSEYNNLVRCEAWLSILLGKGYKTDDLVATMNLIIKKEESEC